MPGSPSSAPRRTPIVGGSPGLLLKRAEPQSPQKLFPAPRSGAQVRTCSSPATMRNEFGAARPFADAAVPDRRRQRVQWQYDAETNGSETSKRTAPQPQPPVRGSSGPAIETSLATRVLPPPYVAHTGA